MIRLVEKIGRQTIGKTPVRIKIKKKNSMNKLAKEMGYPNVSSLPDSAVDEYVRKLVWTYGEQKARGKIQAQLTFRINSGHARKFKRLMDSLDSQFAGEGWTKRHYN